MTSPFAQKLSQLLAVRGTAAKLSKASGVPTSHLSKICAGAVLPSPGTLNDLLPYLRAADASELVVEYLLLHRPAHARNVRILVSENDPLRDRLERAIAYLDPKTRESLASIVEAVNRSPEKGAVALRGLGSLFDPPAAPAPMRGRLELLPSAVALSSEDTTHPPVMETRQNVLYGEPGKVSGAKAAASAAALAAAKAYEEANPPPHDAAGARAPARTEPARGLRKKPAPGPEGTPEGNQ